MKASRIISSLLIVLGIILAGITVLFSVSALPRKPVLVSEPKAAAAAAQNVMDAVSRGDFAAAGAAMEGSPDLGVDRQPADEVGRLLFREFLKTFTYEVKGNVYASDAGMALDMQVSYLDFDSVLEHLGERTGKLLKQAAEEAEDPQSLYDGEGRYRQELVDQVLAQAVKDAIAQDSRAVTEELTVHLTCEDGQWLVVPDPQLIRVISGGTAG